MWVYIKAMILGRYMDHNLKNEGLTSLVLSRSRFSHGYLDIRLVKVLIRNAGWLLPACLVLFDKHVKVMSDVTPF